MEKPCTYTFGNGHTAQVIQVDHSEELPAALDTIGLHRKQRTLVLVGGASGISQTDVIRLQRLFVDAIAPIAQELGVAVVDGGTDAGIMKFIGNARTQIGGTFPLIGVAAIGTVIRPDLPPPSEEAAHLESHHTHFVLVPGFNWGDESPWLAHLASVLSEGCPSVTVVVNGGEITFQDVSYSVQADRPVVALDGTGRTADKLAAALHGEATDWRAMQLAASGQVQAIELNKNPTHVALVIKRILSKLFRI